MAYNIILVRSIKQITATVVSQQSTVYKKHWHENQQADKTTHCPYRSRRSRTNGPHLHL